MTKTISFSFNVLNGNEIIAQETLNYTASEKQLREVAAVMDGNGGHRVELCALEELTWKRFSVRVALQRVFFKM